MNQPRQRWRKATGAAAVASVALLFGCAQLQPGARSAPAAGDCRVSADDERWLAGALDNWRTVTRQYLKVRRPTLPHVIAYDSTCTYAVSGDGKGGSRWTAARHAGQVVLPNGAQIPPAPNAFNAVTDSANFVVMSLPSIWRPVAPRSAIPLDWFLEAIMLHELTHAFQASETPAYAFPALHRQYGLPGSINDDSVQGEFKDDRNYVRAYEAERDLLFQAAAAPDDGQARSLACQALEMLRKRRAGHFADAKVPWTAVDEVSLTTEGLGEWVGYQWLTRGRGLDPAVVLPKMRGHSWSQEQGLAAFLVIDRLVPGWQRLALGPSPESVEKLLARACGR